MTALDIPLCTFYSQRQNQSGTVRPWNNWCLAVQEAWANHVRKGRQEDSHKSCGKIQRKKIMRCSNFFWIGKIKILILSKGNTPFLQPVFCPVYIVIALKAQTVPSVGILPSARWLSVRWEDPTAKFLHLLETVERYLQPFPALAIHMIFVLYFPVTRCRKQTLLHSQCQRAKSQCALTWSMIPNIRPNTKPVVVTVGLSSDFKVLWNRRVVWEQAFLPDIYCIHRDEGLPMQTARIRLVFFSFLFNSDILK